MLVRINYSPSRHDDALCPVCTCPATLACNFPYLSHNELRGLNSYLIPSQDRLTQQICIRMRTPSQLWSALKEAISDIASLDVDTMSMHRTGYYPLTPEDISRTVRYLQKASPYPLPDELIKMILWHGDYDCIHFEAHYNASETARSHGSEPSSRSAYVETRPLKYISPIDDTSSSSTDLGGRVRAVYLKVVGRDQGWGGDGSGSWSWFEVAKRGSPTNGRKRDEFEDCCLTWAYNKVASKDWQTHETDTESNPQLREWANALKNGDRVAILPMAQFPGWACSASFGSIDVEVEVWR
ncbi:hypothetical protein CERZMDRAFT_92189 [Cercospora zeae-maydis SCOH1-5]|uniref:Uncharacterized protein n=1 Tax=Cercospora zeae-maydis SCOH1-5 TaxID=717836 RepID=A0A6A6FVY1_9PEZI|nr:hypothetical protein CERZMDRAFT_92189 [Cercospora zeae-maydis SCOH1-5]